MRLLTSAFKVANVSSLIKISDEQKCKLCRCVLFEPVKCSKCAKEFCQHCYAKFHAEVGTCPLNCLGSSPVKVDDSLLSSLKKLTFICVYKSNGCDDELGYENVPFHIERCSFKPVECP